MITCRNKNILELLGKIKYIVKINFASFYIFNVGPRTFRIASESHLWLTLLVKTSSAKALAGTLH